MHRSATLRAPAQAAVVVAIWLSHVLRTGPHSTVAVTADPQTQEEAPRMHARFDSSDAERPSRPSRLPSPSSMALPASTLGDNTASEPAPYVAFTPAVRWRTDRSAHQLR